MKHLRTTLAALLLPLCAHAAPVVTNAWVSCLDAPLRPFFAVQRGETVALDCTLLARGTNAVAFPPGTVATFYWQTNGMGSAWWSTNATVAPGGRLGALWTPAMDPGADAVSAYIGAVAPGGEIAYRAAATLRFIHAPGAVPGYLTPPVQTLDFNRMAVENAPWPTPDDLAAAAVAATNYTDAALAALDLSDYATTDYVADAITDALADYTPGGGGIQAELDPLFTEWHATNRELDAVVSGISSMIPTDYVHTSHDGNVSIDGTVSIDGELTANSVSADSIKWGRGTSTGNGSVAGGWHVGASGSYSHAEGFGAMATNDYAWVWQGSEHGQEDDYGSHGVGTFSINPVGGLGGLYIGQTSASGYLAALQEAAASYTDDTVINYYALSSLGRIYVTTNDYLFVETRDSATNVWETAWSSYAMQTNAAAVAARMDDCEETVRGAVSAWADYDALGHENPDGDVILLNRAYTAIGSGYFWASSGGHYCLCTDGTVAFAAVEAGSFRLFGESISNYVGLVNGGSITVGANANGFTVSGSGADATASITYAYAGGAHPTIYGASTLAGPWAEMANAVWVDDSAAGTSTATFPATADAFFYKATTTQNIGEYWNATVPSFFPGGVKTSANDVNPVVYDSTITISSGGHTYRLPAQLVQ